MAATPTPMSDQPEVSQTAIIPSDMAVTIASDQRKPRWTTGPWCWLAQPRSGWLKLWPFTGGT
ncbi:hypothetical protein SCE1572_19325 [Sorangium cellulosum So0157-2]|uniref:Uncharacterized protein n=1 Tax=Sorangium cellulosum So0157-2 TaxID=1254432 RepID=S4Y0N7_SORCE|nr:hypothetical protein SCE1572_19325 [Sorangium cellulosum So0157-2]